MFDEPLPESGLDLGRELRELEARLVREALERCGGNVTEAARLLQLKRTTLVERLRRGRLAA